MDFRDGSMEPTLTFLSERGATRSTTTLWASRSNWSTAQSKVDAMGPLRRMRLRSNSAPQSDTWESPVQILIDLRPSPLALISFVSADRKRSADLPNDDGAADHVVPTALAGVQRHPDYPDEDDDERDVQANVAKDDVAPCQLASVVAAH